MTLPLREFLNNLKCPLCGNQIDLIENYFLHKKGHNFGCVNSILHYSIWLVHWDGPIRIEKETVMIYDVPYLYEIIQENFQSMRLEANTQILIRDIDAEHRTIDGGKFKTFNYKTPLFNFQKTNQEKLLNRVKTILVFQ